MKSTDFLQAAIDVQAERAAQYDQPTGERSMGRTVAAFNAVTGRDLTEAEGWLLLTLLKQVRQWQNPSQYHHDSALDGVAYASLLAEALHEAAATGETAGFLAGAFADPVGVPDEWVENTGHRPSLPVGSIVTVATNYGTYETDFVDAFDWVIRGDTCVRSKDPMPADKQILRYRVNK